MSTFKNIPIKVEVPSPLDDTAVAHSVLREIQVMLAEFVRSGQGGEIDLRQIPPMGPDAYQFLKQSLGSGEVSAMISGACKTELRETAYPGIWWVTHSNRKNEVVTEIIEVTDIPEILKSQPEDVHHGLIRLEQHISLAEAETMGTRHLPGETTALVEQSQANRT